MKEDFDLNNFWNTKEEKAEGHISSVPSNELIAEVEQDLGYKLPKSYLELMKQHNGGFPAKTHFAKNEAEVEIVRFFSIGKDTDDSLCGKFGSEFMIKEWGYPQIGVAIADTISGGHEMIFLDYRELNQKGEPKVVLVDQESDYAIIPLANSFEEFIRGLTKSE